jgi:cyd operon protein YbgT
MREAVFLELYKTEKKQMDKALRRTDMWYFSWLLGLPLAAAFAVLNAMWYELMDDRAKAEAASKAHAKD